MIRKMLIAAAALVVLAAAPAAAQYDFSVSPTRVEAGGVINVSGKGCEPFSTVYTKITQRATGTVIYTGEDQTDANGEFTFAITLPKNLAPGWYDLEARCPLDGSTAPNSRALQGTVEGDWLVFREEILIVGPGGTDPGDGVDDGDIVRTGSDLNGLGLVGAGLLTVGGLVLIASKRRTAEA